MSCNFRQPLAGAGDLSSSRPSSPSASASNLWPPSKVNALPQVQINSTPTDQRPPLLLPLSTSTHTSPTTGEIRASLADLTASLNTASDRSLIAWLNRCVPPTTSTPLRLSLPLAKSSFSALNPYSPLTHTQAQTQAKAHTILPPTSPEEIYN